MNKLLKVMLSALCLVSLVGCSTKDVSKDDSDSKDKVVEKDEDKSKDIKLEKGEPSTDVKDAEIGFNGYKISLPCTYDEFVALTGYQMKETREKSYLEADEREDIEVYNPDDFDTPLATINIENYSREDMMYKDCTITGIYQDDYVRLQDSELFTFPGNLKIGSKVTKDDLVELFGEPEYEYEDEEDYEDYSYEAYNWSYGSKAIMVTLVNGKVSDITIAGGE